MTPADLLGTYWSSWDDDRCRTQLVLSARFPGDDDVHELMILLGGPGIVRDIPAKREGPPQYVFTLTRFGEVNVQSVRSGAFAVCEDEIALCSKTEKIITHLESKAPSLAIRLRWPDNEHMLIREA